MISYDLKLMAIVLQCGLPAIQQQTIMNLEGAKTIPNIHFKVLYYNVCRTIYPFGKPLGEAKLEKLRKNNKNLEPKKPGK